VEEELYRTKGLSGLTKRGKSRGGGMIIRFTRGHESDSFLDVPPADFNHLSSTKLKGLVLKLLEEVAVLRRTVAALRGH
jgi:hypothetical protein